MKAKQRLYTKKQVDKFLLLERRLVAKEIFERIEKIIERNLVANPEDYDEGNADIQQFCLDFIKFKEDLKGDDEE